MFLIRCMFKYNIFHFYYGITLLPGQLDLLFYKLTRKKVIFEYLGKDAQEYQKSVEKYELTNITAIVTNGEQHDKEIIKRKENEAKYACRLFVCAPYLSEFVPGSSVLPLAIDIDDYFYSYKEPGEEIVVMHAPTHRGNKGTEYVQRAIDQLREEGYKIKIDLCENITHKELKQRYLICDIFIDGIVGGWYGTAAIEAMALGRPVICFYRESYYQYIDYGDKIPMINANIYTIYETLKQIVENREMLKEAGIKSRQFVEEVHDVKKITAQLIEAYKQL